MDPAAKFGPVSGAIAYGLGVVATAAVGDAAGFYPWVGLVIGGTLGICAVIRAHWNRHTPEAKVARWIAWMGAGTWLFAVWQFTHPADVTALVVLAVMSYGGGQLAFFAKRKKDKAALAAAEEARRLAAEQLESDDPRAKDWRERIERVCNLKGVQVIGVEDWKDEHGVPTGNGFTVEAYGPPGGTTWADIAGKASGLGGDARLPLGCEVQVLEGVDQGAFLIDVPTRDAFADEQDSDLDITPRSILHGLDLGVLRNGGRGVIPVREQDTVVAGTKGSGKTTLLHRFIKQIGCCTDAMVGVADMNEGDIGRAWAQAWWDGKAPYPVVAWVAWDPREAYLMAQFALGMAKGRKRRSGPLKRKFNTSLMPIGNGAPGEPPPYWATMFDESAELMGDGAKHAKIGDLDPDEVKALIKEFMATLETIARIARDAGVAGILAALRVVDGFMPPGLLALIANRIGMRIDNDRDPGHLFGWPAVKGGAPALQKGGGRFSLGYNMPLQQFQSPNMTPNDIYELSIAIAEAGIGPWDLPPEDIEAGEELAGKGAWTERWARAEAALFGCPRIDYDTQQPVITKASTGGAVTLAKTTKETVTMERNLKAGTLAGAMSDLAEKADALEQACLEAEANRAAAADEDGEDEGDTSDIDEVFAGIVAGYAATAPEPRAPGGYVPGQDWRADVVDILKKVGPNGAGPLWISQKLNAAPYGHRTSRQTVSTWLNGPECPPVIVPAARSGRFRHQGSPS